MQRKLQDFELNVNNFLTQREHLSLVLRCRGGEALTALKLLDRLEDRHPSDLFVHIMEPVHSVEQFFTDVLGRIGRELELVNQLRAREQLPPHPALPADCSRHDVAPFTRMRRLVEYLKTMIPSPDGRLILVVLPSDIGDAGVWASLVGGFLVQTAIAPWMTRLRVVIRDEPDAPVLVSAIDRQPSVDTLIYEIDLSTGALMNAVVDDARDETLPRTQRVTALLQLAAFDYAYGRLSEAASKYAALYDYYAEVGNRALQAHCLHGMGDVLARGGHPEAARSRYQQGLALAIEAQSIPVMLNALIALGALCMGQGAYADAAGYLELAEKTAGKAYNPVARADALENLGEARFREQKYGEAMAAWQAAAAQAGQFGYFDRWLSSLGRLRDLFRDAGMQRERDEHEREIARVTALRDAASVRGNSHMEHRH